jgi:hypothetical protein
MTGVVWRKVNAEALYIGLVLIAAGLVFLTGNLGIVIRYWWPMLFVLVGIPKLLRLRTLWYGVWLVTVGAWLELVQLHQFGLTYANSWPLLLIIIGGIIALRAVFDVTVGRRDESSS